MPKRQECALTISSEHSDLAAASVIWFTCCSQAAAAAAAIRAGNSEVSHASDMPKRQECALTISSEHSDLAAASVIWFTCCSQAAAAAAAIRAGNSEVSHASDMPKRQECALTISSEHSDLAAASVIWFTCCSQARSSSSRYPCRQSVYL
uniref:Secreted protein n=1 Tax=Macrostomum lignano TaxID=282301 RepID=A0A1I8HJ84_9PLAT